MKVRFTFIGLFAFFSCSTPHQLINAGKPYQNKIQHLPGRIECEYYNEGGEGIAYHDSDSINNGSGKLNPANGTFLNEFRMNEGVDISYTKAHDIDNNPYNKVPRDLDKLYVGWTKPGEWIKYTVKVDKTGDYVVGLMYTANGDGLISLDLDGKDISGPLKVSSTHDDRDTVAWRQWHHWNKADSLTKINLKKGVHVLTLHVVGNGNMNFDYLEFTGPK
jgi:chitinase